MAVGIKTVLVVNVGSSSVKAALFGEEKRALWSEEGELDILSHLPPIQIDLIGHRIVHGGERFKEPLFLNKRIEEEIRELNSLAPLHNPPALRGIKECRLLFPSISQYALFDTAFHTTLPKHAYTYAIPKKWREKGVRKYGFHGISVQSIARQITSKRCVVCHLGSGASLTALYEGKSIDTTMGFSPLDGLIMGTRPGSLDPAIPLYLCVEEHVFPTQLEHVLNCESGLLALCDCSDMRAIEKSADEGHQEAREALDLFTYRFKLKLGEMIAALEGLDTLVFTGGIGEHSAQMRARLAPSYLGIEIDREKNHCAKSEKQKISTPSSAIEVWMIPTEEEWEIAHTVREAHARAL